MGINSGEVIVGKIGDDLRMEYTAQGHTVGLAARMENVAPAHGVCVSENTAALVSGYVELRDLGATEIKGASEPVRVFELVGMGEIQSRFDRSRARGLTRFVGRADDMAVLDQALEQARAGSGQVVGVVAEAGAGKSRLCFEFVERCRTRGLTVLQGSAVAHGRDIPFLPILQIFRQYFAIGEQDDHRTAREKITGRLLPIDETFRELLPVVFDFMAVSDPDRQAPAVDPDARQRQLFNVMRGVVARGEGASVIFIEDLHWIDAGSAAWLGQMAEAAAGSKTLLLVNFRPGYHAAWMQKSWYRQLPLLPLSSEAIRELLGDLLGADPSIGSLADAVHARTAGNPFFAEEIVQNLVESGSLEGSSGAYRLVTPVEQLEVPTTVESVLAARIDRLGEREKQALQAASVIGREFSEPILSAILGWPEGDLSGALRALKDGEFLYEQSLYPVTEYAFKHPLTQEVALGSQLKERRARTHAGVARTVEELCPERLDEQAALLAYHWEQAGEFLIAVRWNARAADWGRKNDMSGAIQHWRTASSLLARTAESDEREQLELEVCRESLAYAAWLGASEEEIAATFARGRVLAEARGDQRSLCQLHLYYSAWHALTRNDIAAFARHAQEAADLAERVGDEGAALGAAVVLALVAWCEGRVFDAIAIGKRALPREPDDLMLGSDYWKPPPVVWLMGFTRFLEGCAGRPSEGLAGLERPFRLARIQGFEIAEGILHLWAIQQGEFLGDAAGTMVRARRMLEITEKIIGIPFAGSYYCLGIAHLLAGNSSEAASCLERAIAIHAETGGGPPLEIVTSLSRLAVAYADLGQSERARETAARGLQLLRQLRLPVFVAQALTMQSQVLRKTQGAEAREEIEAALTEAEGLVQSTGIRSWQPFIHVERAELARLVEDETKCEHEFRAAHRLFTEMGATGHVERLAKEIGVTESGGRRSAVSR